MQWFLINIINKHGHKVTKTPYVQLDHHECKIKLYRTKWKIVITANPIKVLGVTDSSTVPQ